MPIRVLNLGAGVQSTTLYLLGMEPGGLRFECAVFADTGDEPGPVYKHLAWLQSLGGPPIMVRSLEVTLSESLTRGINSTGQRFVSIPAYTAHPGEAEGQTRRQCTKEFKTNVIERTIRRELLGLLPRQRAPKDAVVNLIGISLNERHRCGKIWKRFAKIKWAKPEFPLVDMGWGRIRCQEWLKDRVPHEVPRSACVYCPFRGNAEWLWLQEHDPVGWDKAVAVDASLRVPGNVVNRGMDKPMFVHRSCVPLPLVDFTEKDTIDMFSAKECQGMCGN
jgi:hypothetical protein